MLIVNARLFDPKLQQDYYCNILHQCLRLGPQIDQDGLDTALTALSLNGRRDVASEEQAALKRISEVNLDFDGRLSVVLMAMRKLREGMVGIGRVDTFFSQVYRFIIRFAILARHPESYHPALLHLLGRVPKQDIDDFIGYYVLDLACRQGDLATAYQIKQSYRFENLRIDLILKALAHGNWCSFWKIQDQMDIYQQGLAKFADAKIRGHAVKCIGKSYLSIDKSYIMAITRKSWEQLQEETGVAWGLEEGLVIIRRIKKK